MYMLYPVKSMGTERLQEKNKKPQFCRRIMQ